MNDIKKEIAVYTQAWREWLLSGRYPDDDFFDMEDDLLEKIGIDAGERHFYNFGLQRKMASLQGADDDFIVKEIRDFLGDLFGNNVNLVFFRGIEIIFVHVDDKGLISMFVNIQTKCEDDMEDEDSGKHACMLFFRDFAQLESLLSLAGVRGERVLHLFQRKYATKQYFFNALDRELKIPLRLRHCLLKTEWAYQYLPEEVVIEEFNVLEIMPSFRPLVQALDELDTLKEAEQHETTKIAKLRHTLLTRISPIALSRDEVDTLIRSFATVWREQGSQQLPWVVLLTAMQTTLVREDHLLPLATINKALELIMDSNSINRL